MSDNARPSFDLVERPWVLVQWLDGRVEEVSLRELFRSAHEIRAVVGEVPTQTFAIVRMLLAILHRSVDGPVDESAWAKLWRAGQLPMDGIEKYLGLFRDRFDLLHPERPFFQVADLRTAKGEVFGLERLIADVPNNEPYFTTRIKRGVERVSFAEAARWVVHCQAFDPSGIKSGAVGDQRVKGGKGYPIGTGWAGGLGGVFAEGRNLRETLLLNLIADSYDQVAYDDVHDLPVWERKHPDTAAESNDVSARPYGPLDLYTWQSRRIRLYFDTEGVYGVLIANGNRAVPHNRHQKEPMTAWRRSPNQERALKTTPVYLPNKHEPDRSLWRGLAALLPATAGRKRGKEAAPYQAPLVLQWLDQLRDAAILPEDLHIRTRAIGMEYGNQQATTDELIDDALDLSLALLREENPELGQTAENAADAAEQGARALGQLATNLADAAGNRQGPEGPRSRAQELAYATLDRPFRAWLATLGPSTSASQARKAWHIRGRGILLDLGQELLAQSGPSAWVGREVNGRHVSSPEAEAWFRRHINKTFPLALPEKKDKVPA